MSFTLETERCVMRPIDPAIDAPGIYAMNLDPEVNRYTGDGPYASVDVTRETYERYVRDVYPTGFGRWTVLDRATGELLGWCGLKRVEGEIDLGYRFVRKAWGRGIATECARACVEWGFREKGVERISAWSHRDNAASTRVLEKLGFRFVRDAEIEGFPVRYYERLRGT